MLTGRKYRLALTPEQEAQCEEFGNICRAVWNTALEQRREYRRRGAWMNYVPQCAELAEAKREFEWLRVAPGHSLQQTLKDLDAACRSHGAFKVRWRSKSRWSPSFRFPDGKLIQTERLGRKWGQAKIPKLGWVRFRWSRPIGGTIRSATISRKGADWYITFLIDDGVAKPEQHVMPGTAVGVDRGVVVAAATSNGDLYDRQFVTVGEQARRRRLQQKLSRQQKGSANRRRTIAAMNRISGRVTNRRNDFTTWTASRIAQRNALVVLEDLKTKNMTASASGSVAEPGRQVRQKAGLNRAILDKGWNRLELALASSARYTGTTILKIHPAYTSQTCNRCGGVDPKSRKSQADFECTSCGYQANADVNAAKNILKAAGHAVSACGDLAIGRSVKQEPAIPRGTPQQLALPLAGIPQS